MRTFHFYVDDARCGEPWMLVVEARNEARARQIAERLLDQSQHHLGVEVCETAKRLFGLGTLATRIWCERHSGGLAGAA